MTSGDLMFLVFVVVIVLATFSWKKKGVFQVARKRGKRVKREGLPEDELTRLELERLRRVERMQRRISRRKGWRLYIV